MNTNIQKWGNSQGIRLPKHLLDDMQWSENEEITIMAEDDKIIIQKAAKDEAKNIKDLFLEFEEEYAPVEMDWGCPVGKEIW